MIKVNNLNVTIANKVILQDINCEIKQGQITAILGSNGAGKSTFLKSLTGTLKAESGNIILDNKNLADYSLLELAQKRAVLSQNININFPFNVREIVAMGLENSTHNLAKKEAIIDEVLEMVAATNFENRLFNSLSGGEQQRVNIARVLAQILHKKNCYLFLDEPTSALDLKYQHLLLKIICKLKDSINLTSCLIIHDLNLAKYYCDNVILLKDRKILAQGITAKIMTKKNLSLIYEVEPDLVMI